MYIQETTEETLRCLDNLDYRSLGRLSSHSPALDDLGKWVEGLTEASVKFTEKSPLTVDDSAAAVLTFGLACKALTQHGASNVELRGHLETVRTTAAQVVGNLVLKGFYEQSSEVTEILSSDVSELESHERQDRKAREDSQLQEIRAPRDW